MAAANPPEAPVKLFREEAQTSTVQCPVCGGPIALHGFGAIERVVCPYCGSTSTPGDHETLALLERAKRARRASVLRLHERGRLGGALWEILGIVWRECTVEGRAYPWQELLLYNPYKGYRYLVYSMTDGQWTLGTPLPGVPQRHPGFGHEHVVWKRQRFKHFQTVVAIVTYVEGEFPWQVHAGDRAIAREYVAPPQSISIEESIGPDGQDLNFTLMQHLSPREVWAAFGQRGAPPRTWGIGPAQPNPWREGRGTTWASLAIFLLAWAVLALVYVSNRQPRIVLAENGQPVGPPLAAEIEVMGTRATTIEVELHAFPLSNNWVYADVMLIPRTSEEALGFGVTAESWQGIEDGESWHEGNARPRVVIGGVDPGTYLLQVAFETAPPLGAVPNPGLRYDLVVRQDVVLFRYLLVPLAVILGFPFVFGMLGYWFERRRWANSDYAPGSDD